MKEEKKEQEIHSEGRKEERGEESGERSKFECRRLDRIRVKIDHLKRSMLNPAAAVAAAAAARHAVSTDSSGDVVRLATFIWGGRTAPLRANPLNPAAATTHLRVSE